MSTLKVNTIRHTGASSDAVTLATDGTCTAKITNNLSNRNLIINGACNVAQRGTSKAGAIGYQTVDRINISQSGGQNAPDTAQRALTSSDTGPWAKGFRNCYQLTNGDQSSADADDYCQIMYKLEAQDVANSGWDYTSTSSYITLSFWVKSSVAQTYYVRLNAEDASKAYSFAISVTTSWQKITKSIPGNSNLVFNDDNGCGIALYFIPFYGTNYTTSGHTNDSWITDSGSDQVTDMNGTWWLQDDATFELTGLQLEVGDVATDFEHRSYGDELARCQRYYYLHSHGATADSNSQAPVANAANYNTTVSFGVVHFPVTMRSYPTIDAVVGTSYFRLYSDGGADPFDNVSLQQSSPQSYILRFDGNLSGTAGYASFVQTNNSAAKIAFQAEL